VLPKSVVHGFNRLVCLLFVLLLCGASHAQVIASAPDKELDKLRAIAVQFESEVHLDGFDFRGHEPAILIQTTPGVSSYSVRDNTVREARYEETSAEDKSVFDQQAAFSHEAANGKEFFEQSFYRFFLVHELGHWVSVRVALDRSDAGWSDARRQMSMHVWEQELEANRISVAYWRKHDPAYLTRLVAGYRNILKTWPSPVPAGRDTAEYFDGDYFKTQKPTAQSYSWFQFTSILMAYDERPVHTVSEIVSTLPTENYGIVVK
jgi:hypothetical protein